MNGDQEQLIKTVETVSEKIQILALNIAVAAAKMSYRQQLTGEVNSKLSHLVHQATTAVKNMNQLLNAARADLNPGKLREPVTDETKIGADHARNIESALMSIIDDSQKIMEMLARVKQR